ncbi:iron chelate uptake ABC transporter family permease subunit [Buchnera aphidicola (Periphyllus koelreuteriae)]|uniref:iron chelate uptake ABC transporter family permease subunit n=1 Tax=Buchnera aphidicola TaxID=9 RepID=UPI0031B8AE0A
MNKQLFFEWFIGIFIILISSPIGALIVWKRMSFFGDSLSHSLFLGVSLSYIFNFNYFILNIFLIIFFLLCIFFIETYSKIKIDAIVNILTNISLSIGIILLNIISKNKNIDIPKYLFGDLSKICVHDIFIIFFFSIIILMTLYYFWEKFLFIIVNSDLAQINGINVYLIRFILMFLTAFTIGISIQFFGVLLITSLLVIPTSISQKFSYSPENSVIISIILSIFSLTLGIFISYYYLIPISPIIVLILSIIFIFSLFFKK